MVFLFAANPLAHFKVRLQHRKGHTKKIKHAHHNFGGAKVNAMAEKGQQGGQSRKWKVTTSLKQKSIQARKYAVVTTTRAKLPMSLWDFE